MNPDLRIGLIVAVLFVAVMASAIAGVYAKHESRKLFTELQKLSNERDRVLMKWITRRRLADPGAAIEDLASSLGPEGRAVLALIMNRDAGLVDAKLAALPGQLRHQIRALDLKERDLASLETRLLLLHGADDRIIPPEQSAALAAAALMITAFVMRAEWILAFPVAAPVPVYLRNLWLAHRSGEKLA